ncbi:MAG TPA: vanadium-dependent haloperoxidase [Puia sp.]|nr:vanadium-dependent haloperoxidase [Puia sp.]
MRRILIIILFLGSVRVEARKGGTPSLGGRLTAEVRPALYAITMVMVHDVVDPPAASRYYSYITLAAYDLVARHDRAMAPPAAFIRSYPADPVGRGGDDRMAGAGDDRVAAGDDGRIAAAGDGRISAGDGDYRIAAVYAILETGRQMLPSGYLLEKEERQFVSKLHKWGVPQRVVDRSLAAARVVVQKEIGFAEEDRYNLLSAKLRYTPLKTDSAWYPTPPSYLEAIEPNWRIIRPMIIDSPDQFIPPPLTSFSKDTASAFYRLAMEVYRISKDTGAKSMYERTIAGFWDCNPFAIATSGHMMIGLKKMSPGGHWMDIAGNAAAVAGLGFDKTVEAETLVAVTLMDGFISAWDEKYRSNRLRPETYIDRYIDPRWQPYLQTPPFPEYTSAHSVISSAAAQVLTYLFGDRIDYTDNAEELFDIKPRTFHSFREAAAEAAISRLYGGIHYRDAVVNGQTEGIALGKCIVGRLRAAGVKPVR